MCGIHLPRTYEHHSVSRQEIRNIFLPPDPHHWNRPRVFQLGHLRLFKIVRRIQRHLRRAEQLTSKKMWDLEDTWMHATKITVRPSPCIIIMARSGKKYISIDLNMDNFTPDPNIKTYVNLNVNEDHVKDNTKDFDLCCAPHDKSFDVSSFINSVNDTLPRISCDISVEDFVANYILKREPVMLTGCIDTWKATKTWTMRKVLER